MKLAKIAHAFKNYQKAQKKERQTYLNNFEIKMIYRTTKTENAQTTPLMVRKILHKLASK
jgi:hypothetical protein